MLHSLIELKVIGECASDGGLGFNLVLFFVNGGAFGNVLSIQPLPANVAGDAEVFTMSRGAGGSLVLTAGRVGCGIYFFAADSRTRSPGNRPSLISCLSCFRARYLPVVA
jgi:hypothetical protein